MAAPLIHHRSPEFASLFSRVNENLRYLFQTAHPVVTLGCSGTGGMEAVFVSCFSPGDTILTVNGGKFGARWVEMPRVFGLRVHEMRVPWGAPVHPKELVQELKKHPEVKAVCLTQSETSTGTALHVRELARAVHDHSRALVVVDGISSVGALELRFDDWGVDVCVTGSQKGIMIPPGLAFVAIGPRGEEAIAASTMPRFYLDLGRALASQKSHSSPWTPAVSLVVGLDIALQRIRREGMEKIWERHRLLGSAVRAGVQALDLRLFSSAPSDSVTAVWVPDGVEWPPLRRSLIEDEGITVAGGQGEYAGKIFRLSHLGYYDRLDAVTLIAGLEGALRRSGHELKAGSGVTAVQEVFEKAESSTF
jgi:serine---pyruvate transaminase